MRIQTITGQLNTDLGFNVAASPVSFRFFDHCQLLSAKERSTVESTRFVGSPTSFSKGRNGRGGRRFSSDREPPNYGSIAVQVPPSLFTAPHP
ncbi:hypothetical protein BHE74_00028575 [Ensete ventricosum]|nr:hypothetical protein BHE74_00028575 [Ensete ventricosum]